MTLISRLDPIATAERLQAWLETRLGDADDIRVHDLSGVSSSGFSTEVVFFQAEWRHSGHLIHERLAARVAPMGAGLFPDYDLEQEWRVMGALAEHSSVPVPQVLFYEADPHVLGSPFLVMRNVEGRTLPDDPPFTSHGWLIDLAPEDQAVVYDNMLRVIADVHSMDPAALAQLGDVGPRDAGDTPLERQIAYCERYAALSYRDEPNPLLSAGIDWLRENRPGAPEPTVLCWGDARFANVIVDQDLSIVGAVDWEEATVASPELDLGYFLYALHNHTVGIGVPLPPGFPSREATIARYEELSGRSVSNVDYYETVAAVRGVLIMGRIAGLMIDAGVVPPDSDIRFNNQTTHRLADLLGLSAPDGSASSWVGRRTGA